MNNVVIAGYKRSPFHFANKGALVKVRPDDLAATVIQALVKETGVELQDLEDLIVGCAFPEGEQGFNVGRLIGLLAGLPVGTAGTTVNRFCGSSMQAIHMAAGAIAMGAGRGVHCRRCRIDDARADGRVQPDAQSETDGCRDPGLHFDGRYR